MRDKKSKSEKTPEQEALEKRVDAMMDPKKSEKIIAKSEPAVPKAAAPLPDAVQGATTAPRLSSQLRKKITISGVPTEPLSIDKLDELTESITASEGSDKPKAKAKQKKAVPEPEVESNPEESDEPAAQDDITEKSTDLDNAQTDKAVEDIVAYESDVVLAVADSTSEARNRETAKPEHKKRHVFSTIVWSIVAVAVVLVIGVCILLFMGEDLSGKLGL